MTTVYLNVDGRQVATTDVTLDDLYWLYNDFKRRNGYIPTYKEALSKNNLPQGRIINRVLKKNNLTYNDFMNSLGKYKKVRTANNDYQYYLDRYSEVASKLGRALKQKELSNNHYGLPSAAWFVKYCPEQSVNTYDEFIEWLGYKSNKLKKR